MVKKLVLTVFIYVILHIIWVAVRAMGGGGGWVCIQRGYHDSSVNIRKSDSHPSRCDISYTKDLFTFVNHDVPGLPVSLFGHDIVALCKGVNIRIPVRYLWKYYAFGLNIENVLFDCGAIEISFFIVR